MEPPDNANLIRAMRAFFDAPESETERYLRPVLEALLEARLIAGDDEGPITLESDSGELFLPLFTDLIELHMFEPGSRWIAMPTVDAIRSVAEGEFDGLIVNPAGQELELTREDVLDFFDIDAEGSESGS